MMFLKLVEIGNCPAEDVFNLEIKGEEAVNMTRHEILTRFHAERPPSGGYKDGAFLAQQAKFEQYQSVAARLQQLSFPHRSLYPTASPTSSATVKNPNFFTESKSLREKNSVLMSSTKRIPVFGQQAWINSNLYGSQAPGYKKGTHQAESATGVTGSGTDDLLAHLNFLYDLGISHIISVDDSDKRRNLIQDLWESIDSSRHYITNIHGVDLEVTDHEEPTTEQLVLVAMTARDLLERGQKVLIHCGYGAGRTSCFLISVAMYMDRKLTYSDAMKYIQENYQDLRAESIIIPTLRRLAKFYTTYAEVKPTDILSPGKIVSIQGLAGKKELNGREARIEAFDSKTGRYIINLDLQVGDKVTIHGLTSTAGKTMNGQEGEIMAIKGERCIVNLAGESKSIKIDNLKYSVALKPNNLQANEELVAQKGPR